MRIDGPEPLLPADPGPLLSRLALPAPHAWGGEPWQPEDPAERPAPVLVSGDPPLVAIGFAERAIAIAPAFIWWKGGAYDPVAVIRNPEVVPVAWDRPVGEATVTEIQRAIDAAVRRRRRGFRRCIECGELLPREWLMSADFAEGGRVCHGCAERGHGVVF